MSRQKKTTDTATPIDAPILLMIKNEHKYTLMLLSVLREQLSSFDIGKTPDYRLMYDTIRYISDFPERFNHPAKHTLIQAIIDKEPENNEVLESLLAEKRQISPRSKEVIRALKALLKEETILKEEQLKIFCKNFVELLESHIETESQLLFSKARTTFSEEALLDFHSSSITDEDPALTTLIEERYLTLSKELNKRWDEFEEAANEFALAEFIGMSKLFESIEPVSIGVSEISKIVKEFSYKLYMENYECYKDLLTKKHEGKDYIEKPSACFMSCYKEYVKSLQEIKQVIMQRREQISEPYAGEVNADPEANTTSKRKRA